MPTGSSPNSIKALHAHRARAHKVKHGNMLELSHDAAELYKAGVPVKDIAKRLGICERGVNKYIRLEGVPTRREVNKAQVVDLYHRKRLSTGQIAERLGISYTTVRLHLLSKGLQP